MTVALSMYCDADCDEINVADPGEIRPAFINRCRHEGWTSRHDGTSWTNHCPIHKETA